MSTTPPERQLTIIVPAGADQVQVNGQGNEDPNIAEVCNFLVEVGKDAVHSGTLSEAAYLEGCRIAKAKFLGVAPERHAHALEILGDTVCRLSALQDQHTQLKAEAFKVSKLLREATAEVHKTIALRKEIVELQEQRIQHELFCVVAKEALVKVGAWDDSFAGIAKFASFTDEADDTDREMGAKRRRCRTTDA